MRKFPLLALLISAFSTQADLLTALQAYDKKDYTKAAADFNQLIPLASEQAAFNLGAMAYNGEGQPRDLVKALSYFEFAATRQHPEAKTLAAKIRPTLSAAQLAQANTALQQLLLQVQVDSAKAAGLAETPEQDRLPLKRVPPQYPKKAASLGVFGSVTMRLLINEQGDVEAVDVLNAYPKGLFENDAVRALKRWKYQPGDSKTISRVMLTFSIGEIDHRKVERIFTEHKLWEYSALGSPTHQNALANLLQLARTQSDSAQFVDKTLPPALGPLNREFVAEAKTVANELNLPADYQLDTFVNLDEKGVVTAVHDDNTERLQKASAILLHKQLTKQDVPAGFYRLQSAFAKKSARLLQAKRIPQTYSNDYWLEQAARGGNLDAQRALAALQPEWEMYLLKQQDPVVQSWAGTRLILDGKKAEGEKLLDAAIAKGHATAKELKAVL
jgi:TonB family protein